MNSFKTTDALAIPKMHPLFKGLLFAAAARSDDETRYTLTHILVEREDLIARIVATDGRRLHIHEYDAGMFDSDICDDLLDAGLYEVIAKTKGTVVIAAAEDRELKFPDWRRIVPDYEPEHSAMVTDQTVGIFSAKTGVLLAVDFVRQACGFGCGGDKNAHVTYGSEDKKGAFVIEHELGKAYVMPVRWDNGEAEDEKTATAKLPGMEDEKSSDDEPELPTVVDAVERFVK
jgi:hypothetical protein